MPASLTLRGPCRGFSGHDRTVRSFAHALLRAGTALELVDLPHWSPAKLPTELQDRVLAKLVRPVASRTVVHFCMPHQVIAVPGKLSINFTMFEADRVPRPWIAHNLRHDRLVVPTESALQAWVGAGFARDRIRLCPLGIDVASFRPGCEPLALDDGRGRDVGTYRVRVLNVSEIVPRKNLLGLLRVWIGCTRPDDDAVLLVKLSHGRGSLLRLLRDLKLLEQAIGRTRADCAPIRLFDDTLSDAHMPRLYAAATHYWSMSCGEGWDQPMTEAAATGLRLIAPDHTAYRTYLTAEVATLLPCRAVPVELARMGEQGALFAGASWWQPDEGAATDAIRRAIGGEDAPQASARAGLAADFTWDRAARRLLDIVDELESGAGHVALDASAMEGALR